MKKYLLVIGFMCFIMFACKNIKSEEKHDGTNPAKREAEVELIPDSVVIPMSEILDGNVNADIVISIKKDDIIRFENIGEKTSGNFFVLDYLSDTLLVRQKDDLILYKLPTGEFISKYSHPNEGSNKIVDVGDVAFSSQGNVVVIFRNRDNGTTLVKKYSQGSSDPEILELDRLYGYLVNETDSTYLATNGIGTDGGQSNLYRLNRKFEVVDSVMLPESFGPREVFNKRTPILTDGQNTAVWVKNKLYAVSTNLNLHPYVILDCGDKQIPDSIKASDYKSGVEYLNVIRDFIRIADVRKIGFLLFCTEFYKGETYCNIFNCKDAKLLYNLKVKNSNLGKLKFRVDGIEFTSWPEQYQLDNKIVFNVPGSVMMSLFGKQNNSVGLLMISTEKLINELGR